MKTVRVREHAILIAGEGQQNSLDCGYVKPETLDWLLEMQQHWHGKTVLLQQEGKRRVKLGNYVGYLQSPAGEGIEILPKTSIHEDASPENLRKLLQSMLEVSLKLKPREAGSASLRRYEMPLHEWLISQFLSELVTLVHHGLRSDYFVKEECSRFIRGKLDVNKQLRETPAQAASFHIRHSEFSAQRTENRLLRSALDVIVQVTTESDNWRVAHKLSQQLVDIPPLQQPLQHFSGWLDNKIMQRYRAIRPWCQLVLEKLNPAFQQAQHRGVSLLFPMEKLYENYLAFCLQRQLPANGKLTVQAASKYLVTHRTENQEVKDWFQLRPDFVVKLPEQCLVLDAKWKLIDQTLNTSEHHYCISQSDIYQMYAYGRRYMAGTGDMMLVYPKHQQFNKPLPPFKLEDDLRLWCIPFDLHIGKVIWDDIGIFVN
ncbi:MAG TPA: McrC family protein [Buttiauxella sp.]|jgi:5-methylcytosine-specific restriction enzyme subunit McrC